MANPDDERTWLLALYQIAHSDTRWAKEQGWRVASWSFALFSAIVALYKYPFARAPLWPFVKIVLGILAFTLLYLWHLHSFASETRARSDQIESKMPDEVKPLLPRRGQDPNRTLYLWVQIAAIVTAAVVTIVGLRWIHFGPL